MHGTRILANFPLCTVLFGICTSRGPCASARASANLFSNSQFFWNILENMHVVLVVALLRYQNWHLPSAQWTILKSSKNSSICKTLKIQDARLLRTCTACVQIRISRVHGYSECTVIREVRVNVPFLAFLMNFCPLKMQLASLAMLNETFSVIFKHRLL